MNDFEKTVIVNCRSIFETFEEQPIQNIIHCLQTADELYHNGEESFLTDEEYDALRRYLELSDPTNAYLVGIGSEVRGGKIKLPYQMGSLDQVEIGDIKEWIEKNDLQDEDLVISDKMDGTSTLIVYDDKGAPQIAYSRGNGVEGADISRHIFKISNVPPQLPCGHKLVIRAEVELTETAFEKLRTKVMSRSGKPYKNARNMVAGLMNSKTNPDIVYDYLTVVAYEILNLPELSKVEQFKFLKEQFFQTAYYKCFRGRELSDEFLAGYIRSRREQLDYAIDGIVLEVDSVEKRVAMNPTRDTLNPAYAIKYKVADASNLAIATVKSVTWNVSKHGYLKPQVNIEPVELVGVTVSNATGFNAKFIFDNNIGAGAKVKITRSGDVIPFIVEVVLGAKMTAYPNEYDWTFNETGVDAVLKNHHDNEEVIIQQLIDFFASIDAPHLKEGNVRKFFEHEKRLEDVFGEGLFVPSFTKILTNMLSAPSETWESIIGSNGKKIHSGLQKKLDSIHLHAILGSLPYFGRGIGVRKFKKLEQEYGTKELLNHLLNPADPFGEESIVGVEGFDEKSAIKIINGVSDFFEFWDVAEKYFNIIEMKVVTTGVMVGQKVVFTGFRDKDLHAKVEAAGGEMQSGVSGKTTLVVTSNPHSNTGKIQKAREKGIRVIGIDELRGMVG